MIATDKGMGGWILEKVGKVRIHGAYSSAKVWKRH